MDVNLLFKICNTLVLPFWLALIFLPKHKLVKNLVTGVAIVLALVYVSMLPTFFQLEEGGFGSLQEVILLFKTQKQSLLVGFII